MDMQNKEILFEIVSSGNLRKDVQKLRELGYVEIGRASCRERV